jgi:hypothetical protein
MQKTITLSQAHFIIALCCGLLFFFFHTVLPHDAHAQNRLMLLYSGNVNGETEGCG